MYIKWIVCKVNSDSEKEFSIAQEQWIETQNSNGFIGQVGGWDLKDEQTACIISFWKNEASLNLFMKNKHDNIFFKNKQSKYYYSIEVKHFNSLLNMEGHFNLLIDALDNGKLLRIADCIIKQEKNDHFEKVQKETWIPEMKNTKGMLGGRFSRGKYNLSKYLVSTFWDTIENHNEYVERKLPILKNQANLKDNIEQMVGRQILLVDSWKVINKTTANTI